MKKTALLFILLVSYTIHVRGQNSFSKIFETPGYYYPPSDFTEVFFDDGHGISFTNTYLPVTTNLNSRILLTELDEAGQISAANLIGSTDCNASPPWFLSLDYERKGNYHGIQAQTHLTVSFPVESYKTGLFVINRMSDTNWGKQSARYLFPGQVHLMQDFALATRKYSPEHLNPVKALGLSLFELDDGTPIWESHFTIADTIFQGYTYLVQDLASKEEQAFSSLVSLYNHPDTLRFCLNQQDIDGHITKSLLFAEDITLTSQDYKENGNLVISGRINSDNLSDNEGFIAELD
ncbi:MAG: hypothetical protein AAGJ82_05665, partial [Bacteroidota bacterium]